jgi:hypothetical protein
MRLVQDGPRPLEAQAEAARSVRPQNGVVDRRDGAEPAARRADFSLAAYWLLVGLGLTVGFEPVQALGALPWLEINHLKLLVGASGLMWLAAWLTHPTVPRAWRISRWLVLASAGFLIAATLSAITAESFRAEALKFVGRFASGIFVLLLTLEVVTTQARLRTLIWAIILGAGVSACLGLGEAAAIRC